jgi:prophage maintenance system killer protein
MTKFLDMNGIELSKNKELKESFVKELCDLL